MAFDYRRRFGCFLRSCEISCTVTQNLIVRYKNCGTTRNKIERAKYLTTMLRPTTKREYCEPSKYLYRGHESILREKRGPGVHLLSIPMVGDLPPASYRITCMIRPARQVNYADSKSDDCRMLTLHVPSVPTVNSTVIRLYHINKRPAVHYRSL